MRSCIKFIGIALGVSTVMAMSASESQAWYWYWYPSYTSSCCSPCSTSCYSPCRSCCPTGCSTGCSTGGCSTGGCSTGGCASGACGATLQPSTHTANGARPLQRNSTIARRMVPPQGRTVQVSAVASRQLSTVNSEPQRFQPPPTKPVTRTTRDSNARRTRFLDASISSGSVRG